MIATLARHALLFCAGVFFHMSAVHFFRFEETASHPLIRIWKSPSIASAVWACIQLALGLLIVFSLKYRFVLSLETVPLFFGFCLWGILRGFGAFRRSGKARLENSDSPPQRQ
jgi:hypothetical protein